jgi:integrase
MSGNIADFWRSKTLSTVSAQTFKEFYTWRRGRDKVKNHTLHKDVVLIRQILKHAMHSELLEQLPHIPPVGKIEANPRPWFTPNEQMLLLSTSIERIRNAPNERTRRQRQDLQDFIDFLEGSMLRVGELRTLRFHSCRLETNRDGDKLLLCEVSGKRGTRTAVANALAATVYENRLKNAKPSDLMFPNHCKDAFRELLEAAGLRTDERGFTRNLKSLRATSISTRLLENPELNLAVVARNAGTSVQMIDMFYAKRLTAEMNRDVLSALPDGLNAKSIKKAERRMKRRKR